MKFYFLIIYLGISFSVFALSKDSKKEDEKKIIGIEFLGPMFGHIRTQPSNYAESLSAMSCGHPIKLYDTSKGDFQFAKVGPYEGYVKKDHLSKKRPECFQDKYPKFFEVINLDVTEMFYWGKLNDQYIIGKSRLK